MHSMIQALHFTNFLKLQMAIGKIDALFFFILIISMHFQSIIYTAHPLVS